MLTPLRALFAFVLVLLLGATLAAAPTLDEIDAGARRAGKGLKGLVRRLASNKLEGRNNDTQGSLLAQQFIVKKLMKIGDGLAPGSGSLAYLQPFTRNNDTGANLLAVIPGRELPDEYVMVGAHYDHLGTNCETTPSDPDDEICNGATDNASGTAVVLAVGKALAKLKEPPRRSVILALWDAEEDGLEGSAHYAADPLVPLEQTIAYVNLDIQGAVLTPSLQNYTIAVGSETGGAVLRGIVEAAVATQTLDYAFFSYAFGQDRSDYANFGNATARVPTVFFGDSTGACYHTTGDELSQVDFRKLAQQSAVAFRTVLALAEADEAPTYVEPGSPLVSYDDAVALRDVIARGIPADLDLFPPDAQTAIMGNLATLEAIVAEGAAEFGEDDGGAVLVRAGALLNFVTALDCPAF
jgi:Peptidase family M28